VSREDLNFGARYLRAAAEKRGWTVTLHPDGAFAGEVRRPGGTSRFFVRSTYDINTAGAALVARDKALTKFFLSRLGHPVLPGRTLVADPSAARAFAAELGYPVMVKANSGAGGEGIERAETSEELDAAVARAFAFGDVVLVEPYVAGLRDYRLLVLDGELLVAYERRPFAVEGDGHSTVRELVDAAVRRAEEQRTGRPVVADLDLARLGRTWSGVPGEGESLRILDVANLSRGGSALEIVPSPRLEQLAIRAARDMNLRFCGVDLLTDDGETVWILELNASPTIHQFATLCRLSEERLAAIFERVLLAMVRP
jgi:glutathione synthase/RimK-type ligase-like ATP-grasp enzyme